MNPNTQQCPNCRATLQPNDAFCPMCGAAVPPLPSVEPVTARNYNTAPPEAAYPVQPPPPVGAQAGVTVPIPPVAPPPAPGRPQPVQAGYQPWQPQTGPVAAPPAPPMPGAPPPAYGPPPPGAYPPAGGGFPQAAPPKKRNKALIAIVSVTCVLLVACAAAIYYFFGPPAETRREAALQQQIRDDYQTLMEAICDSTSPDALVAHGRALEDFSKQHPDVVEEELKTLVEACDEYEYGDRDDEDTFENMQRTLERLEKSDNSSIAGCAAKLLVSVTEEYAAFVERVAAEEAAAAAEEEENNPPEPVGPPVSDPFQDPFPYELDEDFASVDGSEYYYEYLNLSGRTIDYIDTWIFCYDAYGNPIEGEPIEEGIGNMEWTYSSPNFESGGLSPMESYESVGDFSNCPDTVYALPFISFVRFTDGSYWGITDYTEDDGTYYADYYDVIDQMLEIKEYADEYALEMLSEAAA